MDESKAPAAPFHGHTVMGYLPVVTDDGVVQFRLIVVLIDRGEGAPERYVTGMAATPTDAEWYWGHYFTDAHAAVTDLGMRAAGLVRSAP